MYDAFVIPTRHSPHARRSSSRRGNRAQFASSSTLGISSAFKLVVASHFSRLHSRTGGVGEQEVVGSVPSLTRKVGRAAAPARGAAQLVVIGCNSSTPAGGIAADSSAAMGFWTCGPREREKIDFDAAAHQLFAQLNLNPEDVDKRSNYNPLDAIWKHPTTGAKIYIGNSQAAQRMDILNAYRVRRIVNCTDNMPNYNEGQPSLKYLRFDISNWPRYVDSSDASMRRFTSPLFSFVTEALENGENVMVHCLAGAHRAGTTGVACLMHFAKLPMMDAVRAAKKCRPVVDPIGMLPEFLRRLQRLQTALGTPAARVAAVTAQAGNR